MNNHLADGQLLADEFTKRINALGISRRELTQRTGLSRQTLHNIEHRPRTGLQPATLQALDRGLYWRPGTCFALLNGDASVLTEADELAQLDRTGAYRWRIVERLQRMSLAELERMVAYMEGEQLGETPELRETQDVIAAVESIVAKRLDERLAGFGDSFRETQVKR